MSYCVNCGVELDASAKKCVLCDTVVINPNVKVEAEKPVAPFSDEVFIPSDLSSRAKKRIALAVITMVMLIPNIVCLLINLTLFKEGYWAVAVNASSLFVWLAFVFPFCMKKVHPYILWATDSVMAMITALVCVIVFGGGVNLFSFCLLPLIGINSLIVLGYMLWWRKKRHVILKLAFVFLALAVSSFASFMLLFKAGVLAFGFHIAVILAACFAALFGFFIYCYSSKTIRKWASKRVFL